jgi:hypothetical protein
MAGNRDVLETFYRASGGTKWRNSSNWLSAAPLSKWHGLTVDSEGAVEGIQLQENNLAGA